MQSTTESYTEIYYYIMMTPSWIICSME